LPSRSDRRVLALDVGSARVGAAVSDPLCLFAQGIAVWRVDEDWRASLRECLARYDPYLVLVGMPRRTDGSFGPEAEAVEGLVADLRAEHPTRRFETWDERYTTVMAERALLEGDVSRAKRRQRIDRVAAALILQSWLDSKKD
jgi:putative Holliday junction resolvase